jgi:hypothetical protein
MVTPPFNPCQQKYGIVPGAWNALDVCYWF